MSESAALYALPRASIAERFDAEFVAALSLREKQVQQNYRPTIGIHKWFARRPGSVFRALLLAEFGHEPVTTSYWKSHDFSGLIADPFMGGGTPLMEANRLGFDVFGSDINPMAWWIVRQSLADIDLAAFRASAQRIAAVIRSELGDLYTTTCRSCNRPAAVKYFVWVKAATCPRCNSESDLFPGYRLAEDVRHPRHVLACAGCGQLNELATVPHLDKPAICTACNGPVYIEGPARSGSVPCRQCGYRFTYGRHEHSAPRHRMWAIEYHCGACYSSTRGRMFKKPDSDDLSRYEEAKRRLEMARDRLPIPHDAIPSGDETNRLHRWGYRYYHEMFGDRQLLGLGVLLAEISREPEPQIRDALTTVFSDFLRYQNMLCRYDTYALKCQDIFSVHGFPVGLVQCENVLLGIPRIGSGGFLHFIEKYIRAKEYCRRPYETKVSGRRKVRVTIDGETIGVGKRRAAPLGPKNVELVCAPAQTIELEPNSLDGVFTDPPYFDNVQYSELIDFCYVWIKAPLALNYPEFKPHSTRSTYEMTGNQTLSRGLPEFTAGISEIYQRFAAALKPDAPFVFTYHHNDPSAYAPLVTAMLDAGLSCEVILPAAAEMGASLHIAGTASSVLDSVFVCRTGLSHGRHRTRHDIAELVVPDGTIHRLDKTDTAHGLLSLQNAADLHVPYAVLLYERHLGRPFASHRDAVSELVGDVMEVAIENQLAKWGITFRKTGRAERLPGFEQAPDFFVPTETAPEVIVEAKIASDDGTARDKVARILRLAHMRDGRVQAGEPSFEVIACLDGRGFGGRRQDMRDVLVATRGKVFTLSTLDQLTTRTQLIRFRTRTP